jgi:thymidylate synthase
VKARHFEAGMIDDLMRDAIQAIVVDGTRICPSRGSCTEITAVSFTLTNPRARVSRSASRGRVFSALGELCWYLSGSGRTDDIAYYVTLYRQFDEDGEIFGAYGPRLVSFDGLNQVQYVIRALRDSPSSRQAVIQLFDHQDVTVPHLDVPCTCVLQYLLRDGRLSAITYMRSNDVFRGLPHDLFCFTMLQELIARSVGAELGTYHHMVGSLHMYDRDAPALTRYLSEGRQPTDRAMAPLPLGDPWDDVRHLLHVERLLRSGAPPGDIEFGPDPYWADLGRLLGVYAARNGPRQAIEDLRDAMHSDFFDRYIAARLDLLDRRSRLQ